MSESQAPFLPGQGQAHSRLHALLRVDHAGELAAVHIYQAQAAVFAQTGHKALSSDFVRMQGEEQVHLDYFEKRLRQHNLSPTIMTPIWRLAALGLGAGTALMGPKAAHICTQAVESVIEAHYADQVASIADENPELAADLSQFREDELGHQAHAQDEIESDLNREPARPSVIGLGDTLLAEFIKMGCRAAIKISEAI